ncbi:MAG: RNA methyltransferase [Deltaproteobacteria bacterium]|nr:RNA methyltransferase [Deltaproteobacteria bacterium]
MTEGSRDVDITLIFDRADPRVAFFVGLKGSDPRIDEAGSILIEGDLQVERALRSGLRMTTLFMEPRFYELFSPLIAARPEKDLVCYSAERGVMQEIIGYRLHQGVMAVAARPQAAALEHLRSPIVALNRVIDPENVGTIARSCRAFGVATLIADRYTADPLLRRAIRVSMGAVLELPIAYPPDLPEALRGLRPRMRIVGIEQSPQSVSITSYNVSEQCVLVFGSERHGIEPEVLRECDDTVVIPMCSDTIASLNVSAAAAIALSRMYSDNRID